MSDLQLSLIIASGLAVLGIFGYNKWQEYQHRKVAEAMFPREKLDVLMESQPEAGMLETLKEDPTFVSSASASHEEWLEPRLHSEELSDDLTEASEPEIIAEAVADYPEPALSSTPTHLPPIPRDLMSPESDAVVQLALVTPLKSSEILMQGREPLSQISKPVFWLGLGKDEHWQALSAETLGAFQHLRLVIQLADRRGAVSELELNQLYQTAEAIAVELNAVVDVSDLETALLRGRQLDQFCADVDLQIGINIVGLVPFLGTKIRSLAEAAGMAINWQGQFEKQDDAGRVLFTLCNQETTPFAADTLKNLRTHGLIFELDVPRVAEGGFVFDHMLRLARQFADALQGQIVDVHRRPLNAEQLASIREQFVVKPQTDMATRRIPAGSSLALRLFS